MTTLGEHPSALAATPSRTETVGDGMSTAALITTWVGAAFPLLPAVALIVAIAGRKRSLTRWLNNTAIIVSAIFLAAQIAIPLAFGAALAKAAGDYMNRDTVSTTNDLESLDDLENTDYSTPSSDSSVEPDPAADVAENEATSDIADGDVSAVTTMPGQDIDLDTAYLDTMGSYMEGSGFELSDFDEGFLYETAGSTCRSLDDGGDLAAADRAINDQDIPRAISGTIATVAIVTYCPQHYDQI